MSNWYKDSIILLEEAEEILEQLKQIEVDSVLDAKKLKRTQPKIKNFLDNCRAPLDYVAVYLRDSYTDSKKKVYFPLAFNTESFKQRIHNDFKNQLPQDILNSISVVLPFYNQTQSLGWLNLLTNENKHQKLSSKSKILEQKINHLDLPGNIVFNNNTATGCKVPLSINGINYDLINDFPSNNIDVSNKFILLFEDYDLEVIDLFEDILYTTQKVIEDINSFKN